jgi:hypothetical protein
MSVDQYALTTLDKVKRYMQKEDSDLLVDGINVYCDAGDATAATVEVTATTLVLIITGGVDAGTSTLTFADADKDTLQELVTAINALSGWTANLLSAAAAESTDLYITAATGCLGSGNEVTLSVVDNYDLERLIDSASGFIEGYLNRALVSRDYDLERHDGDGSKTLFLLNYPITAVKLFSVGTQAAIDVECTKAATFNAYVKIDSTGVTLVADGAETALTFAANGTLGDMATAINGTADWTAALSDSDMSGFPSSLLLPELNVFCLNDERQLQIPGTPWSNFEIHGDKGIIHCGGVMTVGEANVIISYTAGFTTVPFEVEQHCNELVKRKWDAASLTTGIKSERLDNYAYTLADSSEGGAAITSEFMSELDHLREITL